MAFHPRPGAIIAGRYRLERPVGSGGMGTVWAGMHLSSKRAVALKLVRGPFTPELRTRFFREARAATAVTHPNVVKILDVFELDWDKPVMVMDLLRGVTLAELLEREERLSLERTADILVPALSAVGTAHARGVVHRDLKPANIFLAEDERGQVTVKILDFGIAKLVAEPGGADTRATRTGATVGTPSYMAPEQATGARDVDHQADVWAFGVLLYECLSGIRPIEGETVGQIVMALMSTGITPIQHLVRGLPDDVVALAGKLLSRERPRRASDLREPFEVLKRYTSAHAPAFGAPVSESSTSMNVAPLLLEESAPSGRRRWVMAFGGAALGVAALLAHARSDRVSTHAQAHTVAAVILPSSQEIVQGQPMGIISEGSPTRDPAPMVPVTQTRRTSSHQARPEKKRTVLAASSVETPPAETANAIEISAQTPSSAASLAPSPVPTQNAAQPSYNGALAEELPF